MVNTIMDLLDMKKSMNEIVNVVSKKYIGGEEFFTEIDAMIKNNPLLLISYYHWIYDKTRSPMILSGEIGGVYLNLCNRRHVQGSPMVVVNGGLRVGLEITSIERYPSVYKIPKNKAFTMIDDSYYSGKTVGKVREFLGKNSCILKNIYVFYDGSKENKDNVKSLYRYYR